MYRITFQITMFVPIFSGVYLFTALYYIGRFVRDDYEINLKAMTLHATSFGFYMASVLLYICAFVLFYYFQMVTVKTYLICMGIVFICSSLSQVVLCVIFLDLGKKR